MIPPEKVICSVQAKGKCACTSRCCLHQRPHIRDESCGEKDCRFAPGSVASCVPLTDGEPETIVLKSPIKEPEPVVPEQPEPSQRPVENETVHFSPGPQTEVVVEAGKKTVPKRVRGKTK